jgi:2-keto-4-pentenoate hydratase/2-oxohepta-3-ene-1,7-dioic acid hydratase in catechol pathway
LVQEGGALKLTGFEKDGVRHIAAIVDQNARDLGTAVEFYRDCAGALQRPGGDTFDLCDVTLSPAVPETARIFCVGINYRSHADEAKELAGLDQPTLPMIFGRWQQSLVVDGESVPVPPNEEGLDWEVEFAAVIGTKAWDVAPEEAADHVLGYAAFNDLSARKKQLETPQFTIGKNADRSGPISPIITKDDVGGLKDGLRVTTHVNGELRQDGNTRDLIHSLGDIIAYITDTITLLPGDIIATGTPGGIGAGLNPPVFLTPGDEVIVTVEGVGTVRTPIVERN